MVKTLVPINDLQRPSGFFLLLVRRSGTHCPKTRGIRSVLWTVTEDMLIFAVLVCSANFSTLEVCYENALYKFTFDIDIDIDIDINVGPGYYLDE